MDQMIAERIQNLRKRQGLSQEELAERIGVSRQAVSKWESGQSMPDVEKIILLSNCFETTTDYLLKGVKPTQEGDRRWNAVVFATIGTLVNIIGLVASIVMWMEWQTPLATGAGWILLLVGSGIYLMGQRLDTKKQQEARRAFLLPNVWLLLFLPMSCGFNFLSGLIDGYVGIFSPFPMLGNSIGSFLLFWVVYAALSILLDYMILVRYRTNPAE